PEPSDTTVRRTLELADSRTLDKIARVRARVRTHVWELIAATPAGFPWLNIAEKVLEGWLVIDLDATLITARSDKQGAAPTYKKGLGLQRLGGWLANTLECLAMLLRPGNAGSNTVADHIAVLAAAIAQIPGRMRRRLLVRVDGAGASHELIDHLLSLASPRRMVLFTRGWMTAPTAEDPIAKRPASAWQPGLDQDGTVQEDKHVAEITHLLSRAAGWPDGLRWIVRRTKPSRRQAQNLTAFEKATGWGGTPSSARTFPRPGFPACPAATTRSTSTSCTASTPSWRTASGPGRRWGCGTSPRKPGRSAAMFAASTQPQLTCQVFEGRFRSPIANLAGQL